MPFLSRPAGGVGPSAYPSGRGPGGLTPDCRCLPSGRLPAARGAPSCRPAGDPAQWAADHLLSGRWTRAGPDLLPGRHGGPWEAPADRCPRRVAPEGRRGPGCRGGVDRRSAVRHHECPDRTGRPSVGPPSPGVPGWAGLPSGARRPGPPGGHCPCPGVRHLAAELPDRMPTGGSRCRRVSAQASAPADPLCARARLLCAPARPACEPAVPTPDARRPRRESWPRPQATGTRKSPRWAGALCSNYSGGDLLSQGVSPQVPSARAGLTSVFGMGTGVTPPLWPPETVAVFQGSPHRWRGAPVSLP